MGYAGVSVSPVVSGQIDCEITRSSQRRVLRRRGASSDSGAPRPNATNLRAEFQVFLCKQTMRVSITGR